MLSIYLNFHLTLNFPLEENIAIFCWQKHNHEVWEKKATLTGILN